MSQSAAPTESTVDGFTSRWMLTSLFLLRVAGLPIDVVAPLRHEAAVGWATVLLALERELDESKGNVVDALQDAIGHNEDERVRRRLLELRRDIFNRRLPRDMDAARTLAERLPAPAGALVTSWLARRAAYTERLHRGEAVLAGEVDAGRAHLRALLADPRLRYGLLLSSPSLDRYLPTYLNAPAGGHGKRARRIERSVLEYVYRTACKTSPFSTLTVVALGRFSAGAGSVYPLFAMDTPGRGHARLNVAALSRLGAVLLEDPALRRDLPVRLTSGLQSDHKRVRYVRRVWASGADDATMSFDSVRENLFYLTQGTVLQEIIDILGEELELPFGSLAERLRAIDPEHRDATEIDLYLRRLLRLSLLTVPALRIDIHSDDPLRTFGDGLGRVGTPWSRALAEHLGAVAELVDRYPAAESDLDTRRKLLAAVRDGLEQAQAGLGVATPSVPQTLIYEDVSMPAGDIAADPTGWQRSLLPSLRRVSELLPVFDLMVVQRLNLKGFFVARFGTGGRCDDVLRLVHEFHRDYYDQYLKLTSGRRIFDEDGGFVPEPNWLRVSEVDALNDARAELIRRMTLIRAESADRDEVVLDDELIDAVGRLVPGGLHEFEPRSFFLQLANDGGAPLGVINRSYCGLTMMFSRFVHCFNDAERGGLAAALREELARLRPSGAVFAELTGGYDTSNLNLHPMVTPYELVCPGDVSFRARTQRIPVDDLSVVHDKETDSLRLYSSSLGVEVIPVYLGFLMPLALPEVQRTMLLFSHTSMARIDMWGGTAQPSRQPSIQYAPRVRYRDVVLERRTWTVPADCLPNREAGGSDAERFLAWQRWRAANGLPRRVFARFEATPIDQDADRGGPVPQKPLYVDFDSTFSLSLLESSVRNGNSVVALTEMLPDTDQLWLHSSSGSYVTEQTVEITATTRSISGA